MIPFNTKSMNHVLLVMSLLFPCTVRQVRRQPSDIRKTFIKYCIVGWGLPAAVVGLCSVLDITGAIPIGYGMFLLDNWAHYAKKCLWYNKRQTH